MLDSDEELNDDKSFVVANKRLPKNYGKEITLNFGFGNKPKKADSSVPSSLGASRDYIQMNLKKPFMERK